MIIILLLLLIFLLCQNNVYGGHKLGIDPEPKIGDLITIENDDINVYFKKIINYKIMPKELLTQLYKEIGINDYHDEIKDREKYINAIEKFYKAYPEYILRLDYLNNLLLSRHVGETIKYRKMYEIESLDPVKFLTPLLDEYGYDKSVLDKFKDKIIYNRESKVKLLERNDVNKLLKLMDEVVAILDENKITYWLDGGTLLGACQNGKFIPWDDDIDLAIPDCDFDKVLKLTENKKLQEKYNFNLLPNSKKSEFKNKYLCVQITDKSNPEFNVDLILMVLKNNKYYYCSNKYKDYPIDYNTIYPLKKIKFEGKEYNGMNKPALFLNKAYLFWRHIYTCSHSHIGKLRSDRDCDKFYKFTTPYLL